MRRSVGFTALAGLAPALAAALLAASAGCGPGGPAQAPEAARRTGHEAGLSSGASCPGTNAHERHINMFACSTCHPTGATFGFSVPYTFPGGTTTLGGTMVRSTVTAPATCTVACHFPMGAPAHEVAWNAPGPLACTECHDAATLPPAHPPIAANATRADCQACHLLTAHMEGAVALVGHAPEWSAPADPSNAGFHAYTANAGLTPCQGCHGPTLAGGAAPACASCHDGAGPGGATTTWGSCTMCHGGQANLTGAPPKATWGNAGDAVRVGAHTTHVSASAIAPTFDCAVCHVKPADALAGGHVDPSPADVRFAGTATADGAAPTWTRTTATCAGTYCHGGTLAGGTNTAPAWTSVGTGQAACGSCHGLPPPAPHPAVGSALTGCAGCHPETMDAAGSVVAPALGGKHLDGFTQAAGGHGPGWMDTASADFHAYSANDGISACTACHGAALAGGSARACTDCHGAGFATNCLGCHGGTDNATGAPPRPTWGSDPAVAVGAHTRHVTSTPSKVGYGCTECHLEPTTALSSGHVDGGAVTVTWGALARTGGAAPVWDAAAGTCAATYCHGNYSGTYSYQVYNWAGDYYETRTFAYAGPAATASWSDGPMACDSCHGNPPSSNRQWHSVTHGGGSDCQICHPDAVGVNGVGTEITDPARHVNGVVDIAPVLRSSCFNCH